MKTSGKFRITSHALALCMAAGLVVLPGLAAAQASKKGTTNGSAAEHLSADEILKRAIRRAAQVEEIEKNEKLLYRQKNLVEKLGSDGGVKDQEELVYEIVPLDGGLYTRLVEKNGNPLAGKDLAEEQKREQKWRKDVEEERNGKKKEKKTDDEDVKFDEELVAKYKTELLGQETFAGRPAWVIAFEPKSNDLPTRRRADRVLNKMAGKLWIDAESYDIGRAEARLIDKIKIIGGIAGSVAQFDMEIEQKPAAWGGWVPAKFRMFLDARILFSTRRQRVLTTWSQHRQWRPEVAKEAGAKED